MDSTTTLLNSEVANDFPPYFKVYKDGRVERYRSMDRVEPGLDQETGLQTKDVVVSPETAVKARIFLPKITNPDQKLPLFIHYHGGAFSWGSPFSSAFKTFLSAIAVRANLIAISIDYRLAPEHPLPIAHEDSFAALRWVAEHSNGEGPEPWINQFGDLGRLVLGGESAGANLAHYVAVRAGAQELSRFNLRKLVVIHPYFGSKDPDKYYQFISPGSSGADDDPRFNPGADQDLGKLKCEKVLVLVAEQDSLRDRGVEYFETMEKNCEWGGSVELYETKGEGHCFPFFNPKSENIEPFMKKIVDFMKME